MLPESDSDPHELEALGRAVVSQFEQYVKLNKKVPPEVLVSLSQIDDSSKLADTVAAHLSLKISDKQELLEILADEQRMRAALVAVERELARIEAQEEIQAKVQEELGERQREMLLREQLKQIQKELGDEDERNDVEELRERVAELELTEDARTEVERELKRLERTSPQSAEYQVIRTFLEWVTELPWGDRTEDKLELKKAAEILASLEKNTTDYRLKAFIYNLQARIFLEDDASRNPQKAVELAKKAMDKAQLDNARLDLKRYQGLAKTNYATRQQADTQAAQVAQFEAQVRQDQAAIDSAKANLDYTTIGAPISGRTGIREVDVGNLVTSSDASGITTITQIKPVSVLFTLTIMREGCLLL